MKTTVTTQPALPRNHELVTFVIKLSNGDRMTIFGRYFEEPFSSNFTCMRAPFADDEREFIGRRFDPLVDVISWHPGWDSEEV